jgi:hypothetical protein
LCKQPNSQQNEIDKNYGYPKITERGEWRKVENGFSHFHGVGVIWTKITAIQKRRERRIAASAKTALAMLPWCRCYLDKNYDYPKKNGKRGE